MNKKIITRFPPSPTGFFHLGSARTALFNYLYAKQNDGTMTMRFEDTDEKRSRKEYEEDILEGLDWLGIEFDKTQVFRQSERKNVYKEYLEKLIKEDKAYISQEEEGDRKEVIRFRNPGKEIVFKDKIRGEVSFDTKELGDFVIARSMGEPLYHLAVVVDDYEMKVTDVIRGEDHVSNTPRQILIQEALGFPRPNYAHLPLILAEDKSKLSKRHGAVSVSEYKEMGYLSMALINHLALLGWNPGNEKELFTKDELIQEFSLERVQKSGAVFKTDKLDWINKEYLKKMDREDFKMKLLKFTSESLKKKFIEQESIFNRLIDTLRERIVKFGDIKELEREGELDFYFEQPEYKPSLLFWKDLKDTEVYIKHLNFIKSKLENLGEGFKAEDVKKEIWDYASSEGRGEVLWPMRVSLSGRKKSPDPFELTYILGVETSKRRIEKAIDELRNHD